MVDTDEQNNDAAKVVEKEFVCEAIAVGFVEVVGVWDRWGEAE
jgi:hypothetical protein